MKQLKLTATTRGVGKKGRSVLDDTTVPGIVYGREFESTPVAIDLVQLSKMYHEAGTNHVITLEIDGKEQDVVFKDIQFNPVSMDISHFDFYAIKKGEKIKAEVPVEAQGDSPAVLMGAQLNVNLDTVEVECIPSKLPGKFVLDVTSIKEIGDTLSVGDIAVPEGVVILTDPETTVFKADEIKEMVVEEETPEEEEAEGEGEEGEEGEEGSEESEESAEPDEATE